MSTTGKTSVLTIRIGKRVRALRKKKKWTQDYLSAVIDMDRPHISNIENGKKEITVITLQKLARALGTTMSALLRGL